MKQIIGLILFLCSMIGSAIYADDRYAKAEDLRKVTRDMKNEISSAALTVRKQMLEDKVFELDLIPDSHKTDVQRAMSNRAKTQLQDITNRQQSSN